MISPFNVRGYDSLDPLDFVPLPARTALAMGVTGIVSLLLVYVITDVIHVVTFIGLWFEIVEVAGFALLAAPLTLWLRKSSSLVPYAIITLPLMLTDLYLQAHYRDLGIPALWDYPSGTIVSLITVLPLRFLTTISVDGIIIGPLSLWISRLIASLFYDKEAAAKDPTKKQREALFSPGWSRESVEKPARDAGYYVLRLLGFGYLSYLLLLALGAFGTSPWPQGIRFLMDMTYRHPLFALSTYSKISFMVILAFMGAYNVRIRWYATIVLAIGHGVSIGASLFFYLIDPPGGAFRDFLLTSAIVDGAMVILFIWILAKSAPLKYPFREEREFPSLFSVPATLARRTYAALAVVSLAVMAALLGARLISPGWGPLPQIAAGPDPTLGNTLTMYGVIALLSLVVMRREKLREYFQGIIVAGLSVAVFAGVVWLVLAPVVLKPETGPPVSIESYLAGMLLFLAAIAGGLMTLRRAYYNVEYAITTFSPSSASNIMAVHDSLFDDHDHRGEVLQSTDRYAGAIRGRKRGLLNFPFWVIENVFPLLFGLHPAFSAMSAQEERYFLRKYMVRPPKERAKALVPLFADLAGMIGMAAHSMIVFASFAYIKKQFQINYVLPGARDRLQAECAAFPPPFRETAPLPAGPGDSANYRPRKSNCPAPLVAPRVVTPVNELPIPAEADYVIVGSGPGGAVMAYRLASSGPRPGILLVERGSRYSPLQDFNDREMEMMPKLYKEGGLQQTKRADMIVMQGECVGGGSVIYNAVCYEIPSSVLDDWRDRYGVPVQGLAAEYARTAKEIGIGPLPQSGINQIVKQKFLRGVENYNKSTPAGERLEICAAAKANSSNAMGDGLWNIGNRYMRKRSMLETYIPWAESSAGGEKNGGREPGGIRVVSNTTAVRFRASGRHADAVLLRTATGDLRSVRIKKAVIIAGGVIASSHFLMRSGVKRNVGKRMSCNFAFPMAFEFGERIRAFDGEQITMGAIDPKNRAIFETYFNPPSAFALSVPFFFDRHRRVMAHYDRMLNFGALVGSEPNGEILPSADLLNGQAFTWELGERDRDHIRYMLRTLLEIGRGAGAVRAVVPTQPGIELDMNPVTLDKFSRALGDYPLSTRDLLLSTAHPQGGNIMVGSAAPAAMQGLRVVDERFRVEGFDNVFVADASVFPGSLTINPQWTIMAMSSMASKSVLELCG
jgi:choline dehydrogenase-like flavoprotein